MKKKSSDLGVFSKINLTVICRLRIRRILVKKAPPLKKYRFDLRGAFLTVDFHNCFLLKEISPKAENFSGFDVRFGRKSLKNDVSGVKKLKNFPPAAGK